MIAKSGYLHLIKIFFCTFIILGIYRGYVYFQAPIEAQAEINANNARFQSANDEQYFNIGVALSTRVGIAYSENGSTNLSGSFYGQVTSIGNSLQEKRDIRSKLISQNMLIIGEYLNLSRTNISSLLSSSNDRKSTLEGYINQLELREKNSTISLESLEQHKTSLLNYISQIESKISLVKGQMEQNFSASKATDTLKNVDEYFTLREQYTISFTDIVYINQFIKQHNFLMQYNAGILNTLKLNKQAIIDETYIVIPEIGDEYLRPLRLIFSEGEI